MLHYVSMMVHQTTGWVGELLVDDDPRRWSILGRYAAVARNNSFNEKFWRFFKTREAQPGSVLYAMGKALSGHVDPKQRRIFGFSQNFDIMIKHANLAVAFYTTQVEGCRKAVNTWTLVGIRNGVVKDIRILIGKLIWEERMEGKYSESKEAVKEEEEAKNPLERTSLKEREDLIKKNVL
jgi:hypothetical protein